MGSPVEDEHNHKGLGMILSSKLRGESEKLNDGPSKGTYHHHHNKPDTDLAATLQTSSKGHPLDEGYSYTEALFTGAPLMNGRPVSESDRAQQREHGHDLDHIDKGHDRNMGTGYAKLEADKSNDHAKEEDSVQIQKEVHSEEGVVGIAINKNPNENQYFQTSSPSSEKGKEVQKNTGSYNENQLSSSNASPYNSKSERLESAKYTQIHEISGGSSQMTHQKMTPLSGNSEEGKNHYKTGEKYTESPLSDRPVEQVHQILVTGKTQENFARNADSSSPFAGEQKIRNRLSDKTNTKSYDEESNLLGSSVYSPGQFVEKQGYRVGGQQHREFHPNIITGSAEYKRPGNSLHQPSMDVPLSGGEPSEKESRTSPALSDGVRTNGDISKLGNKNIQYQSEFIPTSNSIDAENGKADASYEQLGRQTLYQNHEQPIESNTEGASGMIEKTNESMTTPLQVLTPSKGDSREDKFQLRPHKIIESSFDEELTRKITTGPLYRESSHSVPMPRVKDASQTIAGNAYSVEKSEEHESSNMTPPSLPFREGSSPEEFSHRNAELTKDQREKSGEGSLTSLEASNSSQNEVKSEQNASQQMFSASEGKATTEHEDTLTNNSVPQKEQEETFQTSVEHEPNRSDGSSASSIDSPGQTSTPNGANNEMPSLHPYWESEAMRQKGTLDRVPDYESTLPSAAGSTQESAGTLGSSIELGPDTSDASSDGSVKSPGLTVNQREGDKEEQSPQSEREESNPKIFGHKDEELLQNIEQQPVEASIPSSEAGSEAGGVAPLSSSQTEAAKQQDTSNEISSTGSDNGAKLNHEQQPVDALQSSMEHQTETNSGSSDTSDQNESLGKEQRQQSVEAFSPVSESNRVGSFSSNNMDTTTQGETSYQMHSLNKVDRRPDHEDRFSSEGSSHKEEQSAETLPSDAQSSPETSFKPVESSLDSPGPNVLGFKPHEVKVGTPEEVNVMPVADNSKEISEGQKLMPFFGIRNETGRKPEERQNSQLIKENEQDNRNQKIVYFLKMAKGIPLLNSRKPTHYVEHKIGSSPETGPEVNGRRRYPWSWQYKPKRLRRPAWGQRPRRPSQGRRPSYRPTPQPSPYPSPSTGGGGGALGGSSANSNEPQGKHLPFPSFFIKC